MSESRSKLAPAEREAVFSPILTAQIKLELGTHDTDDLNWLAAAINYAYQLSLKIKRYADKQVLVLRGSDALQYGAKDKDSIHAAVGVFRDALDNVPWVSIMRAMARANKENS